MNDITKYHSQADRIEGLEAELKKSNLEKGAITREYDKLKLEMTTGNVSRTTMARILVRSWINGDKSLMLQEIAAMCNLSVNTVNTISYRFRHVKLITIGNDNG